MPSGLCAVEGQQTRGAFVGVPLGARQARYGWVSMGVGVGVGGWVGGLVWVWVRVWV